MNIFKEFINDYGVFFIHSFLTGVFSYVALEAKKIYKKVTHDKVKKDVVKMVCTYVNKTYPNLTKEEKVDKIIKYSNQILKEKGITISDLELRIYIENSNDCFKGYGGDFNGGSNLSIKQTN